MKKRKISVCVMALCVMLALVGCGSSSMDQAVTESMNSSAVMSESKAEVFYDGVLNEEYGYEAPAEEAEPEEMPAEKEGPSAEAVQQERKLIKTVDMNVETKAFDETIGAVEDKVAELGGYIEEMETYNGSSYSNYRPSRNASMTVRIPKKHLEEFLGTVAGISNVVRRSESVEDVTLTYVDLESHKRVLLTERETLLELMKKAEAIEDIIRIETRLSEVRYQIESMESQLRTFDNKIDYSTVHLYVDEVRELTPMEEETPFQRIGNGFTESLRDIKDGLIEFGIWFVVNIPYFILWALVIVIALPLIKVLKKIFCKWKEGKAQKRAEKEAARKERLENLEEMKK